MTRQINPKSKSGRRSPGRRMLLGLLAALTLAVPAKAARTVPVQIDGTALDAVCHLENGVTYVPLRALLDTLGGWDVSWDSAKRAAVAVSGDSCLTADPAADTVTVDGEARSGRVYVQEGVTYVPLRTAAELLGCAVEWDAYFQGAAVTSGSAEHNAVDFYWLSRIISAESRGESLVGQIAVGNVICNRVASDEFPDTVKGVVFDKKNGVQFEPVSNRTIYDEPTEQSVLAARLVMAGVDAAGESLYFFNPALSQGKWVRANRTYHMTIGCHRFYK